MKRLGWALALALGCGGGDGDGDMDVVYVDGSLSGSRICQELPRGTQDLPYCSLSHALQLEGRRERLHVRLLGPGTTYLPSRWGAPLRELVLEGPALVIGAIEVGPGQSLVTNKVRIYGQLGQGEQRVVLCKGRPGQWGRLRMEDTEAYLYAGYAVAASWCNVLLHRVHLREGRGALSLREQVDYDIQHTEIRSQVSVGPTIELGNEVSGVFQDNMVSQNISNESAIVACYSNSRTRVLNAHWENNMAIRGLLYGSLYGACTITGTGEVP